MKFVARMVRSLLVLMLGMYISGVNAERLPVPVVDAATGESGYNMARRPSNSGLGTGSSGISLVNQLQVLQQEVQDLRGIIEQQQYQITQMREEQRDRYLDLDRRIALFNKPANKPAAPYTSQSGDMGGSPDAVTDPQTASVSEKGAYQSAFDLIRNKRYDEAINALSRFVQDYPNGEYTGNAFYWLGEVQIVKANYQEALMAFGALLNKYPQHRKIPDAKYKLGKVYRELGEHEKSRRLLTEVVERYAGSTAAKLAQAELRNAQL